MPKLEETLVEIIFDYSQSFSGKIYKEESNETDVLMDVFGITPDLKRENRQYWGRELGMCWQLLVTEVFRELREDFNPPKKYGDDEPADFFVGKEAVDTKYRVGSGDSGTLKKFRQYGRLLVEEGNEPVFLFVRNDNLPAAITACRAGGWALYFGDDSFKFILDRTGFDLKSWLVAHKDVGKYFIKR
ncbi:MAG: restriction endonuclease [Saprospiraceae bacterium]|nr:restriction endonuclease [Candidatus Opimibacter iunctus]